MQLIWRIFRWFSAPLVYFPEDSVAMIIVSYHALQQTLRDIIDMPEFR